MSSESYVGMGLYWTTERERQAKAKGWKLVAREAAGLTSFVIEPTAEFTLRNGKETRGEVYKRVVGIALCGCSTAWLGVAIAKSGPLVEEPDDAQVGPVGDLFMSGGT